MIILIVVLAALFVLLVGSASLLVPRRVRRRRGGSVRPPEAPRPAPPDRGRERSPEQSSEDAGRSATGTATLEPPTEAPTEPPTKAPTEPALEAPELAEAPAPPSESLAEAPPEESAPAEAPELVRPRFRDRLGKARTLLSGYLAGVASRDRIDEQAWEELEEALILADVGVEATTELLDGLRSRVRAEKIATPAALLDALKADLRTSLDGDTTLHLQPDVTNVWLFVGVNGVGKTTTIGKVALRQQAAGHSVVMAAGDTFRAAGADQLEVWAKRVDAEVVRGADGADPGAVVFDAIAHAAARKATVVLADTAGRLHTKTNLMEELKKVRRVASRPPGSVSEVLLVIDATTGQNGLIQAQRFTEAVGVTGVVLTKLDSTAKGGIAVAIRRQVGLPIKLVGLGEGAGDLVDFDPEEFVDAIFATS